MRKRIKFVDAKTNKWGFIVPDDDGTDVHFRVVNVVGSDQPIRADSDCPVAFDLYDARGRREARNINLLEPIAREL